MTALLVAAAGLALILGARAEAGNLLRLAIGLALAAAVLSCLLSECDAWCPHLPTGTIILAAILATVGLVAWRTRAARTQRRDARLRRSGHPRERALPELPAAVEDAEP